MTWALESDLLLGDLETGHLDKTQYLEFAEDEIVSHLGITYALPLPTLSAHNQLTLKVLQARLASGRLLLAMAAGGEDSELHAYGRHLVEMGMSDLYRVGKDFELFDDAGNPIPTIASQGSSRAAAAIQPDVANSMGPFEIYERDVHAGGYDAWAPE